MKRAPNRGRPPASPAASAPGSYRQVTSAETDAIVDGREAQGDATVARCRDGVDREAGNRWYTVTLRVTNDVRESVRLTLKNSPT